jgi:hypothetical protein
MVRKYFCYHKASAVCTLKEDYKHMSAVLVGSQVPAGNLDWLLVILSDCR